MKRSIWITVLVCVMAWPVHGQAPGDGEAKVLALERLWGEAAQWRDIKAMESIFDDSLAYVDIDGRLMSKAEVLADTKAVSAVEVVVQSEVARGHKNTVIVTGIMRLRGLANGKPYQRYGRFVDTWLYKSGKWVCISSMTTAKRN